MSIQDSPHNQNTHYNSTFRSRHLPVHAGLILEELVKAQHLAPGHHVHLKAGQQPVLPPQAVEHGALPVPPHAAARPPEDEHRVLAVVEQLLPAPQQPLQAGVRHHSQGGAPAHVPLEAGAGGVVHADDARGSVDLLPPLAARQPARADDQRAGAAVHLQGLAGGWGGSRVKGLKVKGGLSLSLQQVCFVAENTFSDSNILLGLNIQLQKHTQILPQKEHDPQKHVSEFTVRCFW